MTDTSLDTRTGRAWSQWLSLLKGHSPAAEDSVPDDDMLAREIAAVPIRPPARLGWYLLILGFCGFLIWAAIAPLDNGVTMPGVVMVDGDRQAVEHPSGGIVAQLNVHEGDRVRDGQILIRLDATEASATARSLRVQQAINIAKQARLEAERDGLAGPVLPPCLTDSHDPDIRSAITLQRQLLASRRAALAGELGGIRESLAGQREMVDGLNASLADKREQLNAMDEQLGNLRQLARDDYIPRNRLLESERMRSSIHGDIAHDLGSLGQARRQASEMILREQQRRDAYQQDVRDQLTDARVEGETLTGKLASAEFQLAHSDIRAPTNGRVVGLTVHTVGGVVQPGTLLMNVVPEDEPLIVEGRMPVESVDKVHGGLPVEVLFTAFDQSRTPRLSGTVELVSADRLEDERTGQPYYRVRVTVPPEQIHRLKLGDQPLRAGMPVRVFVRTGERSLLNYLFKPLFDRTHIAWGDS